MKKRKKKSNLSKKWSEVKREGSKTVSSGLGFVPGLGIALGINNTARGTIRTAKAAGELLEELDIEARRHYRNAKKHPLRRPFN